MRKYLLALISFGTVLAFLAGCESNKALSKQIRNYSSLWEKVDSLNSLGQYASSYLIIEQIKKQSAEEGNWKEEFKTWMFSSQSSQNTGEEFPDILLAMQNRADTAEFPLNQLLHSIIAEGYWSFYQQERWRVLERTNTAGTLDDMRTWGQQKFIDATIRHYELSLLDSERSLKIPSDSLLELRTKGETRLRPTLFDLLAQRALQFYSNAESRLAEPAWRFTMDNEKDFSLYEDFAMRPITHRDSSAQLLKALNLYKQLTKIHIKDDDESALVALDLERLKFVRSNSVHPQRDSLYLRALEKMQTRITAHPGYADVAYGLALWHNEQASKYDRLGSDAFKWERKQAVEICEDAITKFPGSVGGKNCKVLAYQLHQPSLAMQLPHASAPNKEFLFSLDQRNLSKVHFRLYQLKTGVNEDQHFDRDELKKKLNKTPLYEWSLSLENDGDLQMHSVELPIKALPFGQYLIVASDSSRFRVKKDLLVHARFWCTDLAVVSRGKSTEYFELNVLSLSSGKALEGVRVEQFSPDRTGRKMVYVKRNEVSSKGNVSLSIRRQGRRWQQDMYRLSKGDDVFITTLGSYYYQAEANAQTRTHFFLDRAIYRPGQEIHFKGIKVRGSHNDHVLLKSFACQVELYDVNGQKVVEQSLLTDEFGAFSGTFKAPEGGLTGSMRIKDAHGAAHFRVEEYKRPKFEVVVDPVEGEPRLGESVSVTGKANSYSGVPIDGGAVHWKVTRTSRMPWWCWGYWRRGISWGSSTEIANGSSETDGSGAFEIQFEALPDNSIPRAASPLFNYTIEASVTDINGETRSGTSTATIAYQSVQIDLNLANVIWKNELKQLDIDVSNMNGQHVDSKVDIRVVKLRSPKNALKKRKWASPDRFQLSAEEHAARFPLLPYDQESDPTTWAKEKTVLDQAAWDAKGEPYTLKSIASWAPGDYLIGLTTKDARGQSITVKKHFLLLEPKDGAVSSTCLLRVDEIKTSVEPGENAEILLSSSMPQTHVLVEVERLGKISERKWILLNKSQKKLSYKTSESDRGGYTIHTLCVIEGQEFKRSINVNVPWNNKELHFEWMSFRDKLLPGTEEEWRLKITGYKGNKASAQLLATMYDASLDHFVQHNWGMHMWSNNWAKHAWGESAPFGVKGANRVWREQKQLLHASHRFPHLNTFGFGISRYNYHGAVLESLANSPRGRNYRDAGTYGWKLDEAEADGVDSRQELGNVSIGGIPASYGDANGGIILLADSLKDTPGNASRDQQTTSPPVVRSDFRETAFFFPDLLTDQEGNTILRFKTPDALTRWKVLGLAHTKDLDIGHFVKETVTQRPLMLSPNLPRFFREKDEITVTAKINALEDRIEGVVTLELYDPFSNKALDKDFGHNGNALVFVAAPGESAVVEWPLNIPEGVDAVGVRMIATSKGGPQSTVDVADGEEHVLPVLSDRILVTESLPLPVKGKGTHNFSFEKLLRSSNSSTLKHKALTLEYTPNPAWYAVQALPYIMEFPHECAEQTFSRYYANSLASHITKEKPAIKRVFEEWKKAGSDALISNLEKNKELKNVLLEETPWLMDAQNESAQKQRIAILFDMERMANEEAKAINKLQELQHTQGGWSWFPGMRPSQGITQHIVAGMGHLEKLGVHKFSGTGPQHTMVQKAVRWLDAEVAENFRRMKKRTKKEDWEKHKPSYYEIQYLYARSFFPQWEFSAGAKPAVEFYRKRLAEEWLSYGLQEQAMIATVLHRANDKTVPALILKSLKERATIHEELGMYWKSFRSGYHWSSFPAETHTMLIEAFNEITQDQATVNELRVYLLKLKQTTNWKTTKATAQACYALLLGGSDLLDPMPLPNITMGSVELSDGMAGLEQEAGTGYIKRSWQGDEVSANMGNVSITTKTDRVSWGALHWQYLEQMDKVTPHETPFSLKKDIMLKRPTDAGDELVKLDEAGALQPGDKITIRIELRTDRHLDYVHMKDLRGAGLEPIETLSGYKYQDGLGYYQSIRDAGMHFFFDRVNPGTYVFEYDLRITHLGDFSNGITTAQCMYAPEFNTHSQGERVSIKGR